MISISVIGGSVAGYSAAMALSRSHINVKLFTGFSPGGQIALAPKLDNYPGAKTTGAGLIETMHEQIIDWGVNVFENVAIENFANDENLTLTDSDGNVHTNDAVILCTGKRFNKLGLQDEKKFFGRGLSYCILCDGPLYKNKVVGVVGGGDSAAQGALYLSDFVKKVHIFVRSNKMRAEMDYQEQLFAKTDKVEVHFNTAITELYGDQLLAGAKLNTGVDLDMEGLFVAIGSDPQTELFKDFIKLDERGFVVTDIFGRTNVPRIYAAGDVVANRYKQAIVAAGDGYTAALTAIQDLKKLKK